jgi:hypothetical protein
VISGQECTKRLQKKGWFSALQFFIAIMITCIGFLILTVLSLHIPAIQTKTIQLLFSQIESQTPFRIYYDSYEWWPLSQLRLYNLKVESSGKRVLECEQAQVSYGPSWKRPYVHATQVQLEKPILRLEKDHSGKWHVPYEKSHKDQKRAGSAQARPSQRLTYSLPQIKVNSGTILALQDGQTVLSIRSVSGTLPIQMVESPEGPRIKVELDRWQSILDFSPVRKDELSSQ